MKTLELTLQQKNEIIADLLGFQKTDLGWYDNDGSLQPSNIEDNTFDELEFDCNWNWLMRAVIFIYKMEIENELVLIVRDCLADASIYGTFDAVVEFAQWYNENKN